MKTALRRLFLSRVVRCVVCDEYRLCRHQDDELRGDICLECLTHVMSSEILLTHYGFSGATEWDEEK